MGSTCRFCHKAEVTPQSGPLLKYGPRHYGHARCGCVRHGVEWLDKMPDWVVRSLPWFFVQDLMIEHYVNARVAKMGAQS